MKNIVICGGHLSPALAVIEKLRNNKNYKIYYFGRKYALEGDQSFSLEYQTIKKLKIQFESINTGRLQRTFTWHTLPSLFKIPPGLIQSFFILAKIKPVVVVSFGGYVAFPVSFCAWLLRIPIVTHEQTHSLGLTNRLISSLADVLYLSFKDTKGIPKKVKTVVTGNPIRESLLNLPNENFVDFGDKKLPLLYITGGNLGSRIINETVGKILPNLASSFRILHQCGNADSKLDFQTLTKLKNLLPVRFRQNYQIITQIDPSLIGTIYKNASLLVGRAGANTVNEILAFGLPSILIPLPWAGQTEQKENAELVESVGLGKVIKQNELTPKVLLNTITTMMTNIKFYRKKKAEAKKLVSLNSAEKIIAQVVKF